MRDWAAGHPGNLLFLSIISILELEIGIKALSTDASSRYRAAHLTSGLRVAFAGRILLFTESTVPVCALLYAPDPRSEGNAMIAATAIEHGFAVATRNVSDFSIRALEQPMKTLTPAWSAFQTHFSVLLAWISDFSLSLSRQNWLPTELMKKLFEIKGSFFTFLVNRQSFVG